MDITNYQGFELQGEIEWVTRNKDTNEVTGTGLIKNVVTFALYRYIRDGGTIGPNIIILNAYHEQNKSNHLFTPAEFILTGYVPAAYESPVWFDETDDTPMFVQFKNRFDPPNSGSRTIRTIALSKPIGSNPSSGSITYQGGTFKHAYAPLNPPCIQSETDVLDIYYRVKWILPDDHGLNISREAMYILAKRASGMYGSYYITDYGSNNAHGIDKSHMFISWSGDIGSVDDGISLLNTGQHISESPYEYTIDTSTAATFTNDDSRFANTIRWSLNDENDDVGRIFGTNIVGSNQYSDTRNSSFSQTSKGYMWGPIRNNPAIPIIQPMHNHNSAASVPYIHVDTLADGLGMPVATEQNWNSKWPAIYTINIRSTGEIGQAAYNINKRYSFGTFLNSFTPRVELLPWFSYKRSFPTIRFANGLCVPPTFVDVNKLIYRDGDNAIRFSNTQILTWDDEGVTLVSCNNSEYRLFNKILHNSLNFSRVYQVACINETFVYVASNLGLHVWDVVTNSFWLCDSPNTSVPCYAVTIGYNTISTQPSRVWAAFNGMISFSDDFGHTWEGAYNADNNHIIPSVSGNNWSSIAYLRACKKSQNIAIIRKPESTYDNCVYTIIQVTGSINAGTVFGGQDKIYSADSNLSTAVVHAGILNPGQTALVAIYVTNDPVPLPSVILNGVTSQEKTEWTGNFYKILSVVPGSPPDQRSHELNDAYNNYVKVQAYPAQLTIADTKANTYTYSGRNIIIPRKNLFDRYGHVFLKSGVIFNPASSLQPGALDFTYEWYMRYNGNSDNWDILRGIDNGNTSLRMQITTTGGMMVDLNGANTLNCSVTLSTNELHHIAICRFNNLLTVYVDGIQVGTRLFNFDIKFSELRLFHRDTSHQSIPSVFYSWRATVGNCRYVTSFNPPAILPDNHQTDALFIYVASLIHFGNTGIPVDVISSNQFTTGSGCISTYELGDNSDYVMFQQNGTAKIDNSISNITLGDQFCIELRYASANLTEILTFRDVNNTKTAIFESLSNNAFKVTMYGQSITSGPLSYGAHTVTLARRGNIMTLYIDGWYVNSVTVETTLTNSNVFIGDSNTSRTDVPVGSFFSYLRITTERDRYNMYNTIIPTSIFQVFSDMQTVNMSTMRTYNPGFIWWTPDNGVITGPIRDIERLRYNRMAFDISNNDWCAYIASSGEIRTLVPYSSTTSKIIDSRIGTPSNWTQSIMFTSNRSGSERLIDMWTESYGNRVVQYNSDTVFGVCLVGKDGTRDGDVSGKHYLRFNGYYQYDSRSASNSYRMIYLGDGIFTFSKLNYHRTLSGSDYENIALSGFISPVQGIAVIFDDGTLDGGVYNYKFKQIYGWNDQSKSWELNNPNTKITHDTSESLLDNIKLSFTPSKISTITSYRQGDWYNFSACNGIWKDNATTCSSNYVYAYAPGAMAAVFTPATVSTIQIPNNTKTQFDLVVSATRGTNGQVSIPSVGGYAMSSQLLGKNWRVSFVNESGHNNIDNVRFGVGSPGNVYYGVEVKSNGSISIIHNNSNIQSGVSSLNRNLQTPIIIEKINSSIKFYNGSTEIYTLGIPDEESTFLYNIIGLSFESGSLTVLPGSITVVSSDPYFGTRVGSSGTNSGVFDPDFLMLIREGSNIVLNGVPANKVYTNYFPPGPNEITIVESAGTIIFNPLDVGKTITGNISYLKYPGD